MKGITVVIPTINRYSDLKNTVSFIRNQAYEPIEIIVIDQTPEELFKPLELNGQKLVHLRYSEKSASGARNIGLAKASYDIVLFLDDDVIIENELYVTNVVKNFIDPNCVGVSGPILPIEKPETTSRRHPWSYNPRWGWLFFPRNYSYSCKVKDAGAGNLAVRRELALAVGGMDEQFIKGAHREESDFNMRFTDLYGRYNYDPDCALVHIGRREGGVRSWDKIKSKSIKAQHHFDGTWYFMFKHVKWYDWPPHLLSFCIFFFYRKVFLRRPDWLLTACGRAVKGFFNGLKMYLKGPKYLKS